MNYFEKIDPEDFEDKESGLNKGGKVEWNQTKVASKALNPEEVLIAEEEANEREEKTASLRKKFEIPEWMTTEDVVELIEAGESIEDLKYFEKPTQLVSESEVDESSSFFDEEESEPDNLLNDSKTGKKLETNNLAIRKGAIPKGWASDYLLFKRRGMVKEEKKDQGNTRKEVIPLEKVN